MKERGRGSETKIERKGGRRERGREQVREGEQGREKEGEGAGYITCVKVHTRKRTNARAHTQKGRCRP